jgi:oxygen-independent coproporphyrinogen III oxidase
MSPETTAPVKSLYIHVPFCALKCAYCAFFSEASSGDLVNRYVSALVREMEMTAADLKPRTIFFGGGTPSILNLRQWETILKAMEGLNLLGATEFTIECNPATVSADKAKLFRDYGVNRISMGVQSLDEDLLVRLGRIHSRTQVFKSFDILRQAGFDNVNLDLMFAIPTQTMTIWQATLHEIIAMQSEHLSSYEVIYEDDTPLFEQLKAGEFDINEDLACDMYDALVDGSAASGFYQYEVANFARHLSGHSPLGEDGIPARACQHNVNYWRAGSYYGLGPSATGYVRGQRTKNWANTQLYCEQLEKGKRAIESSETLSPLKRAGETAAFGLRMNAGWPLKDFRQVTGFELRENWGAEMDDLIQRGWASVTHDRFHLTRPGLRFADTAAEMFLR